MIETNDLNQVAILVDFDGTITTEDTNDKLIDLHMNDTIKNLWNDYRNKKISLLNLMELEFKEVKITEEEYIDFILKEFHMTEGFLEFYKNIVKNDIPFAVVSGGFDNGIKPFLAKHGVHNVDIYANSFVFNDDITVKFYDDENPDCHGGGPWGNCKVKHYRNYKKKKEIVIFIGDGTTDKCISEVADIVFAKDDLLDYCRKKGLDCIPWENFNDINKLIFKK